jgi:hypothetical protein
MNRTPDVELVLRDYFADDSSSAPDHVLDVIEERIMRQPQQRAWRISWRDSHVNSYLKPLLAVAAIVVVAVAGFAILRPSGAGVGGAPATETPTLSPAPSTLGATPSPTGAFGGTVHRSTGHDRGRCGRQWRDRHRHGRQHLPRRHPHGPAGVCHP